MILSTPAPVNGSYAAMPVNGQQQQQQQKQQPNASTTTTTSSSSSSSKTPVQRVLGGALLPKNACESGPFVLKGTDREVPSDSVSSELTSESETEDEAVATTTSSTAQTPAVDPTTSAEASASSAKLPAASGCGAKSSSCRGGAAADGAAAAPADSKRKKRRRKLRTFRICYRLKSPSTSSSSRSSSSTSSGSSSSGGGEVAKQKKQRKQIMEEWNANGGKMKRPREDTVMTDAEKPLERKTSPSGLQWFPARKRYREFALAPGFLSQEDINAIHESAKHPSVKEINDRKGNLAFKHRVWRFESQLRALQPELYRRLMELMSQADEEKWKRLRQNSKKRQKVYPEVEYIVYDVELEGTPCFIEPHVDNKSAVTMVAMLSTPDAYDGGRSCFRRVEGRAGSREMSLQQGDVVLFRGEKLTHWITPVMAGVRIILQIEFSRV